MNANEFFNKLVNIGAYQEGEFTLSSRMHTDHKYEFEVALREPYLDEWILTAMDGIIPQETEIYVSIGKGGGLLADLLGYRHHKRRGVVMNGELQGHKPRPGERTAIVEDVITTGGNLKKLTTIIKPTRAEILGQYVILRRRECPPDHPAIAAWDEWDFPI